MEKFALWLLAAALVGCSGDDTSSDGDCDEPTGSSGSATATLVTLGVFTSDDGDCYQDTTRRLEIQVGTACGTWSREAMDDNHSSDTHLHYNAADDTSYDGQTVAWTEYGPELAQADIEATCAAAQAGAMKTANWTDYTADKNFFLRIIAAE